MRSDWGVYVQDRVNLGRLTVQGAIRFDGFNTGFPDQTVGPAEFAPNRNISFPAQDSTSWKDLTYRTGFTYDLTGDGKTAIKVSANRYLFGQTLNGQVIASNPLNTLVTQTNRAWNDANGNFVPDCDLLNPNVNGECGAYSNRNFNTVTPQATFDPELLGGFGNRQANWEFSASIQRELMPGVGLDVGYFRRIWQNFAVTDNLSVAASDYTQFSMTVPNDPRLPNAGQTLTGLYNVNPDKFGQVNNYNTLSRNYGTQIDHWNGMDITVNARLQNGLLLNGGTSFGRQTQDNCEIVAQLPEMLFSAANQAGPPNIPANTMTPADFCRNQSGWAPQFKLFGVYTLPTVGVQVSGTYRNVAGTNMVNNLVATNAYLAANSTLGRPLSGNAPNTTISLYNVNENYIDRRNELDLRVGKTVRYGRTRALLAVDFFNALNANPLVQVNTAYSATPTINNFRPQAILNPRLIKFSVNFDF
jgi:hypothetical protein